MGEHLSVPITAKNSNDGETSKVRYGVCEMQGWRRTMEDTHIANANLGDGVSLFGVFDGHGGREVAAFVKNHLCDEIKKSEFFVKRDYKSCLDEVFFTMDLLMATEFGCEELKGYSTKNYGKENKVSNPAYMVGCTACVALITKDEIYVANAGDSRCILARRGQVLQLSNDHKPEKPSEKKRIENAGGFISNGRVNGILSLSRAMGDLEFKLNFDLDQSQQIITAKPEVKSIRKSSDLDFMVIACDGVWDCLSSQHAVDYFDQKIVGQEGTQISKHIEYMFDHIIARDIASSSGIGTDNMTCIVIEFK